MDKFVVLLEKNSTNNNFNKNNNYDKIYNLIESLTDYNYDENLNDINKWKIICSKWNLTKYENNIDDCKCSTNNKICITNSTNKMMICAICLSNLEHINNIFINIDNIVNNIINENPIIEKINNNLLTFMNLEHNVVDNYNKNGYKNKRNIKVYTILSKIGQYHYNNKEYQEKLNNIYTKISRNIEVDEIINKINNCLMIINYCIKCEPLNQCLKCFTSNNQHLLNITKEQLIVLWKAYRHILNDEKLKYGLYGSAGTGKTTLIKYILQIKNLKELFILKDLRNIFKLDYKKINDNNIAGILKDYREKNEKNINTILVNILNGEKKIVLASPTNKALDVIREKVGPIDLFNMIDNFTGEYNNIKILFLTISKLLTYRRSIDINHNMYFTRDIKYINIINKYNLVIIDESSMVNKNNIIDINNDIKENKYNHINYYKGFILFTGDSAQLPPPKESHSTVFKLKMNKTELKTVMRTDKENIIKLSNFIREWLKNSRSNLGKELLSYKCKYINFYKMEDKFIEKFCSTEFSTILVWTNKTRDKYNEIIRNNLFGIENTKKKFIIGEHLVFNNFYKINTDNEEKVFYSSMPFIIKDIKINQNYICKEFDYDNIKQKIDEKMKTDINMIPLYNDDIYKYMEIYINKFVNMFNNSMNNIFKVWELNFSYKNINEKLPIIVIFNKKIYNKKIENGKGYIKEYFDRNDKIITQNIQKSIKEIIVNIFDEYYIQPFADVSYGYSLTTDSSQGSSYNEVFIDAPDILDQNRYPFLDIQVAKQRFYTAITRAINGVHILI